MKGYLVLILCTVALLGIAGGPASTRVAAGPLSAGLPAVRASIPRQDGPDPGGLFSKLCAACHGSKGEGGFGPALAPLKDPDEASLSDVITKGRGNMPAAGQSLSAAEVDALVGFLIGGLTPGASPQASPAPTAAAVAAPVLPANLQVSLEAGSQGNIIARVDLRSGQNEPIPGAPISLSRLTVMGGRLLLAQLTTDAHGEARYTLDAFRGEMIRVAAAYAGGALWGPAKADAALEVQQAAEAPSLVTDLTSRSTPLTLVAVFAIVLGGVWLTYGVVAYRLLQILRHAKA